MKNTVSLIFILAVLLSGCGSSKKQLQKGNYDAAIDKAVKQLRKDPGDVKQIDILIQSYKIANDQDNERIRLLKTEGRADSWDEIYQVYKAMNDRQSEVRTVTPLNYNGKTVDFPYVDYIPEMVGAKRKAADFYFAHGNELMKNGLKESYRQAFNEYVRAKQYVGDYEGIDNKIMDAKYLGMSRVLVTLKNMSVLKFPPEFEQDLLALDLPRLNSDWVEYHTQNLDAKTKFDYYVNVNVKNVAVSPDQTVQRDSVIKRNVEDGFTYLLDKKGNVMKDSLGNDIKQKKYKTLQCALVETIQSKACRIDGDIEIIQLNPDKVLKKDPIGAQSNFENISSRALGDIQALNQQQLERTKSTVVPFPSDIDMVLRCSESLKMAIRGAVENNRRFIY
jgi:major membrane immunogen (membrane-anchored lipoprotein)